jgi:hypothetical protein
MKETLNLLKRNGIENLFLDFADAQQTRAPALRGYACS